MGSTSVDDVRQKGYASHSDASWFTMAKSGWFGYWGCWWWRGFPSCLFGG